MPLNVYCLSLTQYVEDGELFFAAESHAAAEALFKASKYFRDEFPPCVAPEWDGHVCQIVGAVCEGEPRELFVHWPD